MEATQLHMVKGDLGSNVQMNLAAELLKTMANEHRLMILHSLMEREHSVGELNEVIRISQSALSQHLAWLRKSQVVKTRKEAQTVFYRISSDEVTELMNTITRFYAT